MADLAILRSAPYGTKRKVTTAEYWVNAQVGDTFQENDEIQNTELNAFGLELFSEGGIVFEVIGAVTMNSISGTVKYYNSDDEWVTVASPGDYAAKAVGAEMGGGVMIVCARKGRIKIAPWPVNP